MYYALNKLASRDWHAMVPPAMIKEQSEWKLGYASNKNMGNAYYYLPQDDLIFISSSEHSVVPYHQNEILSTDQFPIKYVNYSPCFRSEAGTYGKELAVSPGLFLIRVE